MAQKPADLLEFLRQPQSSATDSSGIPPGPEPHAYAPEQTIVFRRSQVIVAGVAAGLALILVFLLGLGLGSGGSDDTQVARPGVWGIHLITYKDTEAGRALAVDTRNQLLKHDLDEITLQRVPSSGLIVVMLGSWLTDPDDNPRARRLLAKVQNMPGHGNSLPFSGAAFWSAGDTGG